MPTTDLEAQVSYLELRFRGCSGDPIQADAPQRVRPAMEQNVHTAQIRKETRGRKGAEEVNWTQTNEEVVISFLVDNIYAGNFDVKFAPQECLVSMTLSSGEDCTFDMVPLFAEIDPTRSTYEITPSKIDVFLRKVNPSYSWNSLYMEPLNDKASLPIADSCMSTMMGNVNVQSTSNSSSHI